MSEVTRLRGWQVGAEKVHVPEQIDPEWKLVFTEVSPPTGDQYIFEMTRETRDSLVRMLTDGVVLAGGDFPRL